nr:MAG TPA: hypothetical protein [Caudoviricetes sp.]
MAGKVRRGASLQGLFRWGMAGGAGSGVASWVAAGQGIFQGRR